MTYTIVLTRRARAELRHEIAWSARHWGPRHARTYAEALQRLMRRIAEQPFLFPLRPHWAQGVRAAPAKGNWIVYHVGTETRTVTVLGFPSIHHTADYTSEDL